ncbi:MAG: TonB-dependent receptor, partial [Phocaeicola sp.]|nr:TonB-dependent receptor [Phocaeicola sp.]
SMASYATTRRIHSGDFVRLKNISFGFTLPGALTRKVGLDKVRLYASGSNLLTWAAYDYIDPESNFNWETPPAKTFTLGLEIKF